ncbi:MAG: U32 family peptidase, partial [Chitinivibrionales bacterium]|nr:U32 family peptidase [Chitinivibrionales bacterium]MBD3358341.1 U32 family peptidase [Chitinivibrionales bacterium]
LKIEGRNKSVHYVSVVVKTYRAALDRVLENRNRYRPDPSWLDELERVEHRTYTTGFYAGEYYLQEPHTSKAESRRKLVGVVKAVLSGGKVVVDVKNPFGADEILDVLPTNRTKSFFPVRLKCLADLGGEELSRAVTNRLVVVEADKRLAVGDMIRRNY